MGFHSAAANCASSRHSILRLWRGPSPRAYSRGIISHGLSCCCDELCLFEVLYPAPLARPLSKGLLAGDYLTWTFMPLRRIVPLRVTLSCAFGAALLQGPTRGDYLTWAFIPLRRIVPLRGTPSHDLVRPFSKGLLEGDYLTRAFMPLQRIVPLRGTPSCAFGAALLQGPTRGELFHMDFYTAAASCASSRHSILRLWRGPSPRAYSREEYSSP